MLLGQGKTQNSFKVLTSQLELLYQTSHKIEYNQRVGYTEWVNIDGGDQKKNPEHWVAWQKNWFS